MAATPSLTIVKKFLYRAFSDEEFSNTYHFNGGTPSDGTAWKALADAVIDDEKACYTSAASVVRAYGHEAGNTISVWTYDYEAHSETVAGTCTVETGGHQWAGDQAGVLQWQTADFTSRGKRIYLRKFFHSGESGPGSLYDALGSNCTTGYEALGAAWVSGYISSTYVIAGPNGAAGSNPEALPWVTTRTLKRRGKRP